MALEIIRKNRTIDICLLLGVNNQWLQLIEGSFCNRDIVSINVFETYIMVLF